ncbi:hypothetical protein CC86DRAFT_374296 [Ophiobolus disseminans]|uniref:YDG domain-containing protein n=1 Tax=Ophiobolus disseminans TaxID=1469910 RepID=A0A6A6ZHR2_9PLEO|nr:hypothetical protein CC86DRAFT_374296 [Ophiobolus disseminans]
MAIPEKRQVELSKSSTWLLKSTQEGHARTGLAPDALTKKLQEIKDDPEQARKKAEEHAARMGIDPIEAARKLMAAARLARPTTTIAERPKERPTEHPNVSDREESRTVSLEPEVVVKSRELVFQSASTETNLLEQVETSAPNPVPAKRRGDQTEKKDERKAKKEKVKTQQTKALTKKSASKSASPASLTKKSASKSASPASHTIAESSAAGTTRATTSTSRKPEPMEVDQSPSLFVNTSDRYPVRNVLPKWYTDIKDSSFHMLQLGKKRTPAQTALESLKNCIGRCEAETKRMKLNQLHEELRDHVHKAEITIEVTRFVLKKARILTPENGLPRIFREDANFPSDLKADALLLYTRWCNEKFSQDILRGIVTVKGKDRNGDRLDPTYRAKYPTNAKHIGEGDLVLGQWWPTQMCTVRDGAHGAPQGGIFGDKEHGTYSIVLSGGGYHDKDEGDLIEYSGTDGKDFTPTDATLAMLKSAEVGNEIRVIRSSMLNKSNEHRPEVGLRYDGLYQVKSFVLVDKQKQIHRFKLERCPGQGPIRSGNNASRRPTQFEVAEFRRLKEKDW